MTQTAMATDRARVVRRQLGARGIRISGSAVRYGVADVPDPGRSSLGVTHTSWLSSAPTSSRRVEVRVKRGLPALLFDAVVAHELTHVWFRLHDVVPAPAVEEGVAELTAYWLLGKHPGQRCGALRHRIAHNRDPVYGKGFRAALDAERLHGWPTVAASLLGTGTWPRPAASVEDRSHKYGICAREGPATASTAT